ncbi:MAG: DUF1080 domain-containing protein, partial [Acidobacteriaceae bacterium]|nr:DUF1080 domain-containing protein [Acidobacteriaceae bacterium]
GRVASVHIATNVRREGDKLTFETRESLGKEIPVTWELNIGDGQGDTIAGTQKRSDGVTGEITGVRAPDLDRKDPSSWTTPEPLFNGHDLTGWEPDDAAANHWKAIENVLVNESKGANLRTTRKFQDLKLHIEFNCPPKGNSGVYLRGRYEVQVEYEHEDLLHSMGSIYGFLAPAANIPPRPGTWESFDIVLVGRRVTVVRDDKKIVDNQEIPGITGGALDSHEAEPGPIYIQGDHTGGMKYRNIMVSVPAEK